jgi:hypothetical protein
MELENYVSNVCENNFASESFKPLYVLENNQMWQTVISETRRVH